MSSGDSVLNEGVMVGFTRLNSKQEDIQVNRKEVLGVSYEENARWRKKTMYARCGVGILTIVCTSLVIVVLLIFELHLACKTNLPASSNINARRTLDSAAKFLLFSDFHLDYFYDDLVGAKPTNCRRLGNYSKASYKASYGRVHCDAPFTLIDSMLKAAKGVSQDYNFALMTGDFSAHNTDRPYFTNSTTPHRVLQNIGVAVDGIKQEFPSLPVFPLLGNNDLPGNYILPVDGTWYNETLALFAPLILCSGCPDKEPKPTSMDILRKTYLDGGYYSVNLTKDGLVILIVLNTMYWNVKASTGNPVIQAVARRQMIWFNEQLKQAKINNHKVMIASHIPPGIDPYDGTSFWLSNYTDMYINIITNDYKNVVAGQFYGHIHKDDFHLQTHDVQILSQATINNSFVILSPSVSPVYANNPAFRVVYFDEEEKALLDYDQYYLDLVMATEFGATNWQLDYRFSEHYPSSNPYINAKRIYELNQGLLNTTSAKTWLNYVFSRTVNYQPGAYSRFQLYCAMRYVLDEGYKSCKTKYNVPGG